MPQPLKAYTNITVYGDQGKENQDKMLQMMNGLEDNLDNLSYGLKKRFKNLVVSQLSLLKYRGKDSDLKSFNVDCFKSTLLELSSDRGPRYSRIDTASTPSIDVLRRGNLNNGKENFVRLRHKNTLNCNNDVSEDDIKLSAKFKEAVAEIKKSNNTSSTYNKNSMTQFRNKNSSKTQNIPRGGGSLYSNENGSKSALPERFVPNNKPEVRRGRYSHGVSFYRKQDFPYGIANAASIETNMARQSFDKPDDLGERYHGYKRYYNSTEHDKDELSASNSTVTQVDKQMQPNGEILDCESKGHTDEIINEPLQRQSQDTNIENKDTDINHLEITSSTQERKKVNDIANKNLSSKGMYLKQETLDDILSSGLTVEEYLRLMVNGLNENDFVDYMGIRTTSPASANIKQEKLDNILEQNEPIEAYTKLIKNDMYDDGNQVKGINDGYISQEMDNKGYTTNQLASSNGSEKENRYILNKRNNYTTERHQYQSKHIGNFELNNEIRGKNKASSDRGPNQETTCHANTNRPVNVFKRDADPGGNNIANNKDSAKILRRQRESPVVTNMTDNIVDKQKFVQSYNNYKPHPKDNLQKAESKDPCELEEITSYSDNIVDTHFIQPCKDVKDNAPKVNADDQDGNPRENDRFCDKNTEYIEKDNEQRIFNLSGISCYTRPQSRRCKEKGTCNSREKPLKTTKSPKGLGSITEKTFRRKPDSMCENMASVESLKSTSRPHSTSVNLSPSSNELRDETPKTMISPEPFGLGKVYGRKRTNKPIAGMCRSNSPDLIMNPEKTSNGHKEEQVINHGLKGTDTQKHFDITVEQNKEQMKQLVIMNDIFEITGARPKEHALRCVAWTEKWTNEQKFNTSTRGKLQDSILSESTSFIVDRFEEDSAYHKLDTISSDQSSINSHQQKNSLLDTCKQPDISYNVLKTVTDQTCKGDKNSYVGQMNKPNYCSLEDKRTTTPKFMCSKLQNCEGEDLNQRDKPNNLVHFTRSPLEQSRTLADDKQRHAQTTRAEDTSFSTEQHTNYGASIKHEVVEDIADTSLPTLKSTDFNLSTKQNFKTNEFTLEHFHDKHSTHSFSAEKETEQNENEVHSNQSKTTFENLKVDGYLISQSSGVPREDKSSTRNVSQIQGLKANEKPNTVRSTERPSVSLKSPATTTEYLLKENNVTSKLQSKVTPDQSLIDHGNMMLNSSSDEKPSVDVQMANGGALAGADELSFDCKVPVHLGEDQEQLDQAIQYPDKYPVEIILSPRIRKMHRILRDGKGTPDFKIVDKDGIEHENDINGQDIDNSDILANKVSDRFKESMRWLENNTHFNRDSLDDQMEEHRENRKQNGGKHKCKSARSESTESRSEKSEIQHDWNRTSQLHRTNEMLFLMENLMTENLQEHERFELWNEVQDEMLSMTKNISDALNQHPTCRTQWNIKLMEAETDIKMMMDPDRCIPLEDILIRLKMAATELGALERDQSVLFEQRNMLLRLHSLSKLLQKLNSQHQDAGEEAGTHVHRATNRHFYPIKALYSVSGAVTWPFRTLRNLVRAKEPGKRTGRVSQKHSSAISTDTNRPSTRYECTHCNARNENIKGLSDIETDSDNVDARGIKFGRTCFEESTGKLLRTKETQRGFAQKYESARHNRERLGVDATRLETGLDTEAATEDRKKDITDTCITLKNRISATIKRNANASVRNVPNLTFRDCSHNIRQTSWISRSPEQIIVIAFISGFMLGALFIFFGPDLLGFIESVWLKFSSYIMCHCKLVHTASPVV